MTAHLSVFRNLLVNIPHQWAVVFEASGEAASGLSNWTYLPSLKSSLYATDFRFSWKNTYVSLTEGGRNAILFQTMPCSVCQLPCSLCMRRLFLVEGLPPAPWLSADMVMRRIDPILPKGNTRHRDVNSFAQGHVTNKWNQNLSNKKKIYPSSQFWDSLKTHVWKDSVNA